MNNPDWYYSLYMACMKQDVPLVSSLLRNLADKGRAVERGLQRHLRSPLQLACDAGNNEILALLLQSQLFNPNCGLLSDARLPLESPIELVCIRGNLPALNLLLQDPRLDPNQVSSYHPIFLAVLGRHHQVALRLLEDGRWGRLGCKAAHSMLSDPTAPRLRLLQNLRAYVTCFRAFLRHVIATAQDAGLLRLLLQDGWVHPEEVADFIGAPNLSPEVLGILLVVRKSPFLPLPLPLPPLPMDSIELAEAYAADPTETVRRLKQELGWTTASARLFAHLVFVSDGLLHLQQDTSTSKAKVSRFVAMGSVLPQELQMLLCNIARGQGASFVPHVEREMALVELARVYKSANSK